MEKYIVNPVQVRMKETAKGSVYQAIVAMGFRARQINDDNLEDRVYIYKKSKGYKEILKQVSLTDLQNIKKRLVETIELLRT